MHYYCTDYDDGWPCPSVPEVLNASPDPVANVGEYLFRGRQRIWDRNAGKAVSRTDDVAAEVCGVGRHAEVCVWSAFPDEAWVGAGGGCFVACRVVVGRGVGPRFVVEGCEGGARIYGRAWCGFVWCWTGFIHRHPLLRHQELLKVRLVSRGPWWLGITGLLREFSLDLE